MKRTPFILSDAQISAIRRDYDAGTMHREQALLAAQIPSTKAAQALKAAGIERWHSAEILRKNINNIGNGIGARIKSALEAIQHACYGYVPTLPEYHTEPPPPKDEAREHPYRWLPDEDERLLAHIRAGKKPGQIRIDGRSRFAIERRVSTLRKTLLNQPHTGATA